MRKFFGETSEPIVLARSSQFSLPFGGSKSRSSIFRPKTGRYNFVVLHVHTHAFVYMCIHVCMCTLDRNVIKLRYT